MGQVQLSADYGADYGDYEAEFSEEKPRRAIRHRSGSALNRARAKRRGNRNRVAFTPIHSIDHRRNHNWIW